MLVLAEQDPILPSSHPVRRERYAVIHPTTPDAVRLRWLWSRCIMASEQLNLSAQDGRIGDYDGRRLRGCGPGNTQA